MDKVANASTKQIENIKFIQSTVGLDQLPPKLREVAEIRMANSEVSLKELGAMLPSGAISKIWHQSSASQDHDYADSLKTAKVV